MVGAQARRLQVSYARSRGLSTRRACQLMRVARSSLIYCSVMPGKDAPALAAIVSLSAQYPRYGYRRIQILPERQGHPMSVDRMYRLWCKARLQVPRKRPRKRIACARPRPQAPTRENPVWAYDFVFDACANGQKLKCLTVVDEYTRESLAIDVAGSIRSGRVSEVLSPLISTRGAPRVLRSDNGPEFVSRALLKWTSHSGLDFALIDSGKPWQNGTAERFNGKFRDECLSMEWFRSRTEAKVLIESWRKHYNEVRLHSSLRNMTPSAFRASCVAFEKAEARFQECVVR